MPNYEKKITLTSYRCGDLFTFEDYETIYMLAQTGFGWGTLIELQDSANRLSEPFKFINNLNNISEDELNKISRRRNRKCIGNIKDFNLILKEKE